MPSMVRGAAWKRANRTLDHLCCTPGSEEFQPTGREERGHISEHQKVVDGFVDAVVGPPSRLFLPPSMFEHCFTARSCGAFLLARTLSPRGVQINFLLI
jgi:hypothetical protein